MYLNENINKLMQRSDNDTLKSYVNNEFTNKVIFESDLQIAINFKQQSVSIHYGRCRNARS